MRDATGFRQLSTRSFEAFELEITVNYPVLAWTENSSFMRNLTSWSLPFTQIVTWLSTRSSTAMRRARSTAAWLPDNGTRLVDSVKQTVDVSNFPTIVRKFTQRLSCPIRFWQIKTLNQNLIIIIIYIARFCKRIPNALRVLAYSRKRRERFWGGA